VLVGDVEWPMELDADALLARALILQAEVASLPVLDDPSPDESIGLSERGYF
jgi:hypothetical protein